MVLSIAGHYQDVVCLLPVVNLTSSTIHSNFTHVLEIANASGLNVTAVSMETYQQIIFFYLQLCGRKLKPSIENPVNKQQPLFLLFNAVHNFKNFDYNFLSKRHFNCPSFMNVNAEKPSFAHIERVNRMEISQLLKIAHRLSQKALHLTNIEKANVKLADAVFHESTINDLKFYRDNSYPEFHDTANFSTIIRKMWNISNVKTPYVGKAKRDSTREQSKRPRLSNMIIWSILLPE